MVPVVSTSALKLKLVPPSGKSESLEQPTLQTPPKTPLPGIKGPTGTRKNIAVKAYKMRAISKRAFDELRQFGKILFIDLTITPINPELGEDSEVFVEFKNCFTLPKIKEVIGSIMNASGRSMFEAINYSFAFKAGDDEDEEKSEELF